MDENLVVNCILGANYDGGYIAYISMVASKFLVRKFSKNSYYVTDLG